MKWFYIRNNQQGGPVEEAELIQLLKEGSLTSDDLVWNPSLNQEWKPVCSIPHLYRAIPHSLAVPSSSSISEGGCPNTRLMKKARQSLRGQWALAIGVCILYSVMAGMVQAIPYLGLFVVFLVSAPLTYGLNRFFLSLIRHRNPEIELIFDGFKIYGKTLSVYILISVYLFLWGLFLILPAVFSVMAVPVLNHARETAVFLLPLLTGLFVLASIPLIRAGLSYSLTYYILSDHPDLSASEALARSIGMMDGFKWKKFCLGWRFFGWILLALFTCCIGLLWVFPYMAAANAHFYEDVQNQQTQKENSTT